MATTAVVAPPSTAVRRITQFAWGTLAYNIAVIVWGAYVRATGAGAGCGNHWPLCNGEVIPRGARIETLIEFSHRASSGIAAILVLALLVLCWRALPKRHPARVMAVAAAFLMLSEALLGAMLVKLALVAQDKSAMRAISLPIHSTNTMLLLAAIAATAVWLPLDGSSVRWNTKRLWLTIAALAMLLITAAAGVIAALGDTLFPNATISADFSPTSHFLIRLRILHPALALLSTIIVAVFVSLTTRTHERAKRFAGLVGIAIVTQLFLGIMNIALQAPVWLQMLHLGVADLVWIGTVLVAAESLVSAENFSLLA
ncbi:COX15/CtaA family protein [Candidatus Korobacter versatilis]|nr:COX15/CtaA family protein [Candidatus Koribacter versatilis]